MKKSLKRKNTKNLKKYVIIVTSCILLFLVGIVIWKNYFKLLTKEEALELGEERYLQFLWFSHGAYDRDIEYHVNGKTLKEKDYPFVCDNKKIKNKCYIEDFDNLFHDYFINKITYDKLYGDGISMVSYKKNSKDLIVNPLLFCGIKETNLDYHLEVSTIKHSEIIYKISFKNNERQYVKEFILKYENNKWKISKAFYRDNCRMDYNVE